MKSKMQVSLLGTTYRMNACQNENKKLMPVVESFHRYRTCNKKNQNSSHNEFDMEYYMQQNSQDEPSRSESLPNTRMIDYFNSAASAVHNTEIKPHKEGAYYSGNQNAPIKPKYSWNQNSDRENLVKSRPQNTPLVAENIMTNEDTKLDVFWNFINSKYKTTAKSSLPSSSTRASPDRSTSSTRASPDRSTTSVPRNFPNREDGRRQQQRPEQTRHDDKPAGSLTQRLIQFIQQALICFMV